MTYHTGYTQIQNKQIKLDIILSIKSKMEQLIKTSVVKQNTIEKPKLLLLDTPVKRNFIFVKDNHRFIKIPYETIIYIESLDNYVVILTKEKKKLIIRSTFSEFMTQIPSEKFYRVHRSYAIQIDLIDFIEHTELVIFGQKIPISKHYKAGLFALLGIK